MSSGAGDTQGSTAIIDYGDSAKTTRKGPGWARTAYRVLAWVVLVCIAIQMFLAGIAVFGGAANWGMHKGFVHVFELMPLVMIPLAFLGRLPNWLRWLPLAVFFLIGVQYALAQFDVPMAALHPVNALLIFWATLALARGSSMKQHQAAMG